MNKSLLIFLFSMSSLLNVYSQVSDLQILKTKKSGDFEERFFVYREQPTIKQGQYVRFFTNMFGVKMITELGNYELNQKTGTWLNFHYQESLPNTLKSFGSIVQGLKQGEWSYFYPDHDGSAFNFERKKGQPVNKTSFFIPKSNREICTVKIDTTNVRLMEYGSYEDDRKVGVWEYYSTNGNLLHKYDHDAHILLENKDSIESNVAYLGGLERFISFVTEAELIDFKSVHTDSIQIDLKILESGYEAVDNGTPAQLTSKILKKLKSIPYDWIYFRNEEKQKLHLIIDVKKDREDNKGGYQLRFRKRD